MSERLDLPAGRFSTWLRRTRDAQIDDGGADLPCGECIACCRSSYFIHVAPEETQTLAAIPGELLFAAPDLPRGNVVLGHDENGRCPMLHDDVCSIYEHRPLTCRTYDCRVFAAAGIAPDRDEIARRARRWAFSYATDDDRKQHAAVQAAARFLREHADCFPAEGVPDNPMQVALLAIKVYDVFLERVDESGKADRAPADAEVAKAVMQARERFEAGRGRLRVDQA